MPWLCAKRLCVREVVVGCNPEHVYLQNVIAASHEDDARMLCVLYQLAYGAHARVFIHIEAVRDLEIVVHMYASQLHMQQLRNKACPMLHDVVQWMLGDTVEPIGACTQPHVPPPFNLEHLLPKSIVHRVHAVAAKCIARECTPFMLQAPWVHLPGRRVTHLYVQRGRVREGNVQDRRGSIVYAPAHFGKTFVALAIMLTCSLMSTLVVVPTAAHRRYWQSLVLRYCKNIKYTITVQEVQRVTPKALRKCARVIFDGCERYTRAQIKTLQSSHSVPFVLAMTAQPLGMHTMLHSLLDMPQEVDLHNVLVTAPISTPRPHVAVATEHRIPVPLYYKQFWTWIRHACNTLNNIKSTIISKCAIDIPEDVRDCPDDCKRNVECIICAQSAAFKVHCKKCYGDMCIFCAKAVDVCPFCRTQLTTVRCKHAKPHAEFEARGRNRVLPRNFCIKFFAFVKYVQRTKLETVLKLAKNAQLLVISASWRVLLRLQALALSQSTCATWFPSARCCAITLMHISDVRAGVYCNCDTQLDVVLIDVPHNEEDYQACCTLAGTRKLYNLRYDIE